MVAILRSIIFKLNIQNVSLGTLWEIALRRMPQDLTGDKSTLVQENGLVSSGNKPLPEPMLTQIYVAIWRHWTTMS